MLLALFHDALEKMSGGVLFGGQVDSVRLPLVSISNPMVMGSVTSC